MVNKEQLLKNLLSAIENNIKEDITSNILAAEHSLSVGHLERLFKQAFNSTLGSYIRSRKLAASFNDLLKTNENIMEIALEYNFEFEQSYIRSFKREFGITPGNFRKTGRIINIIPPFCHLDVNKLQDNMLLEQESDLDPKVFAIGGNSYGNVFLPNSPYGYEIWAQNGNDNKLIWYGTEEKGGAAFHSEWNNTKCFSSRIGYFWDEGKTYKDYNDIFCDFIIEKPVINVDIKFSWIGVYGWSKAPLIEWYIIDDWFGYENINPAKMFSGFLYICEFFNDDSIYYIFKRTKLNIPSIENTFDYQQYFSVRKIPRSKGTISVTEHFKQWERAGMPLGKNMREAKFIVEAQGGKGYFDAKYVSFYKK